MSNENESAMSLLLLSPHHIEMMWPKIEGRIQEALEASEDLVEMETVKTRATRNQYQVWVALDDEGVRGVSITKFTSLADGEYLEVLWTSLDTSGGVLRRGLNRLESTAKSLGMDHIRVQSTDQRMIDWLTQKRGYETRMVECVRKVS